MTSEAAKQQELQTSIASLVAQKDQLLAEKDAALAAISQGITAAPSGDQLLFAAPLAGLDFSSVCLLPQHLPLLPLCLLPLLRRCCRPL